MIARTRELETDLGWYYQACTKCASMVNFAGGIIYSDKCKMPRTAVPRQVTFNVFVHGSHYLLFSFLLGSSLIGKVFFFRYKVHLLVIDNSGSTKFFFFDRVVSQVLGRSVHDLLDGMTNVCRLLFWSLFARIGKLER